MQRTPKQNNSMHLYFQQVADHLNEQGLDMRTVLKPGIDIPWTKDTVKEFIWKPVQDKMLFKNSTTELDSDEVNDVYATIQRMLAEKHGVDVPFPEMWLEQIIRDI